MGSLAAVAVCHSGQALRAAFSRLLRSAACGSGDGGAMGAALSRIVFQAPEATYGRDSNLIWLNTAEREAREKGSGLKKVEIFMENHHLL